MAPADECFGATNPTFGEVELGLVVDDELAPVERPSQLARHRQAHG